MGRQRKGESLPRAPWLSTALRDLASARAAIEAESRRLGAEHPLELAAKYAAFALCALEADGLTAPDVSYSFKGEPPELCLAFASGPRRLVVRFAAPHVYTYATEETLRDPDGDQVQALAEGAVNSQPIDEFRRLASWLTSGDVAKPQ